MMNEAPIQTPPLATEKITIDRKLFFLDLKENHRGRFLKITEDVAGRRNTVIIPSEAFGDLAGALLKIMEFERSLG